MKQKYPLRQPLILTHDELTWLLDQVSDRFDDLNRFLQRGRKGQKKLREAIRFHERLRRKLWKI